MNEYTTSDTAHAALLICRAVRLLRTSLSPDRRVCFTFDNANGRADTAALALFNNEAVGARDFVTALQSVKSAIRAAKAGQ